MLSETFGITRPDSVRIWAIPPAELIRRVRRGGKGLSLGKGARQEIVYGQWADAICPNEITDISRIWFNGELVYDIFSTDSAMIRKTQETASYLTIFRGTIDQNPSTLIEADKGVGNVPGYSGIAYAVWDGVPCDDYGNRYPSTSYEVISTQGYGTGGSPVASAVEFEGLASGIYAPRVTVRNSSGASVTLNSEVNVNGPIRGIRLISNATEGSIEVSSDVDGTVQIIAPRADLANVLFLNSEILSVDWNNTTTGDQGYAPGPLNLTSGFQDFQKSLPAVSGSITVDDENASSGCDIAAIIGELLGRVGLNVVFDEIPNNVTPVIGWLRDNRSDLLRSVADLANQLGWLVVWDGANIRIRPFEGVKGVELDARHIIVDGNDFFDFTFADRSELISDIELQYLSFASGHEQDVIEGPVRPKATRVSESVSVKLSLTQTQARRLALSYAARQLTSGDIIRFKCTPDALRVPITGAQQTPFLIPGDTITVPGEALGRSGNTVYTIIDLKIGADSTVEVKARRRGNSDSLITNVLFVAPVVDNTAEIGGLDGALAVASYYDLPNWHNNDTNQFYAYIGWNGLDEPRPETDVLLQKAPTSTLTPTDLGVSSIAQIGFRTDSALSEFNDCLPVDDTLTITLDDPSVQLFSTDQTGELNLEQLLLVGGEIISYRTATLNAPGQYILSGLTRGMFSTYFDNNVHVAGTQGVILKTQNAIEGVDSGEDETAEIGVDRVVRAVGNGVDPADSPYTTGTTTGKNLRPYPARAYSAVRDGITGDLTISWNPAVRNQPKSVGGGVLANVEAQEQYRVTIGSRQYVVSDTTEVVYSLADQNADGLTGATTLVNVSVEQFSNVVGYGASVNDTLCVDHVNGFFIAPAQPIQTQTGDDIETQVLQPITLQ